MSRNVCLLGMMGAGKTTVARRLGGVLGRTVADTDDEIVAFVGRPVPVIFAEAGEPYFREVEHQVIRAVAKADDLVVALGGGAVLDDANVAELSLTGVLVELRADAEVLIERLRAEADARPLLHGDDLEARVHRMVEERAARYAEVADLTVDASHEPDRVVRDVLDGLVELGDVLTPSEHEQVMP